MITETIYTILILGYLVVVVFLILKSPGSLHCVMRMYFGKGLAVILMTIGEVENLKLVKKYVRKS